MFESKTLLITGGTGSFGNAVLNRFLDTDIKEIRIFSRDEKKQDDMRHQYQNAKIKFYIGDVRDKHERAARIMQKTGSLDRGSTDDHVADAAVDIAFYRIEIADAAAQLDRNAAADGLDDRADGGSPEKL